MNQPDQDPKPIARYRGLAIVAAGIVVLVVAAVAVVLLAGGPDEADFEPGSPEAALAAYLDAFDARDLERAHAHFSADIRDRWDLDAYERMVDDYGHHGDRGGQPARRVLFDGTDRTGDVARIRLTIEEFYGDGLGGDTYRSGRDVRMTREGGSWHIDERLIWLDPAPPLP